MAVAAAGEARSSRRRGVRNPVEMALVEGLGHSPHGHSHLFYGPLWERSLKAPSLRTDFRQSVLIGCRKVFGVAIEIISMFHCVRFFGFVIIIIQ